MKKSLKLLIFGLILPVIISCKNQEGTSYTSDVSSESTTYSESSSEVEVVPPSSLEECIENTQDYAAYYASNIRKTYLEINDQNCFYYAPESKGYIILDSDENFMHYFVNKNTEEGIVTEMYGRVGSKSELQSYRNSLNTFKNVLASVAKSFIKENDYKYTYTGNKYSNTFKSYFQLSAFKFCNYYEVNINKQGRLDSFLAGESYSGQDIIYTVEVHFEECVLNDVDFYANWKANGAVITDRIFDLKCFYKKDGEQTPCYNEGEIEAIVTSTDYDGSFYISNIEETNGPIGMRVTPKTPITISPKDKVRVKGDIVMDKNGEFAYSPRFINAEVEILGSDFSIPMFSEESIVDSYAPGVYAATTFTSSPIYSASLYNGYCLVGDIPEIASNSGDTIVNYYLPNYVNNKGEVYKGQIHFSPSAGSDYINEALLQLRELGDYSLDKNAKLVYLQNVIVAYCTNDSRTVDLYIKPQSIVSHRLSFEEMIYQDFGFENFPAFGTFTDSGYFHFGQTSDWYIEDQYFLSKENPMSGVLYYANSITRTAIDFYIRLLKEYGAVLYDKFSFDYTFNTIHEIYTLSNNVIVDLLYDDLVNGTSTKIQIYIYQSETMIRKKSIGEQIDDANFKHFTGDDFLILNGTYDANYHLHKITSFAGNTFSNDAPLNVVTFDSKEDKYDEIRALYREHGWKQYRDENGKAYTYNTRGGNRIVYYRDNDDGTKTFVDFGMYDTSDYTFTNHKKFAYRVEIAIYEGVDPLSTVYTNVLTDLVTDASNGSGVGLFNWVLPEEYKAEYYRKNSEVYSVSFGYSFDTNVFVYPTDRSEQGMHDLLDCIKETILWNGYKFITQTANGGYRFGYPDAPGSSTYSSFIFVMEKVDKGYVRIIGSVGGVDF